VVKKRVIAVHPFDVADVPFHRSKQTTATSTATLRAVFDAACEQDLIVAVGVRMSAALGSRRGEMAALAWPDVDWKKKRIRRHQSAAAVPDAIIDDLVLPGTDGAEVHTTKTDVDTFHPVDDGTLELLGQLRRTNEAACEAAGIPFNETGFVLSPELDGSRPINPDVLSSRLRTVAESVPGGEQVRFKPLRMWAATEIEERHGLAVAQNRLDHRNSGTTARYYLGRDVAAEKAAADDLGEHLGAPTSAVTRPPRQQPPRLRHLVTTLTQT